MKKQEKKQSTNRIRENNFAISVKNLSKTFRVPHQKIDSMRSAFVNLFNNNSYEEFRALDNVSFDVKKGQFVGIIGHNGSGKSTLLKCLAGVYVPDKGSVDINGRISPFLELGIGFNPELSGRDNIYLNATILGLSKQEIQEKFDEIVAFSEIEQFIDQKVKNYSSGMKGRLAFSVSIHANRDILIMDEVLAVGDSRFQQKCMNIFKGYKKQGKTVILVTHSVATVREYCDTALLLHHGKMVASGNVDDVCDEYIERNMTEDQRQASLKKEALEKEEKERIKKMEKGKKQAEIDARRRQEEETKKQKELELQKKQEEEKRIKEEKQRLIEAEKNKKVKITEVEFLDENNNVKNIFQENDDIKVRVSFDLRSKIDDINFGVALYSNDGACIMAVNTIIDKVSTKKFLNEGFFEIIYNKVILNENDYYVHVVIFGSTDSIKYDILSQSDFFKVKTVDKHGLVQLNYKWN